MAPRSSTRIATTFLGCFLLMIPLVQSSHGHHRSKEPTDSLTDGVGSSSWSANIIPSSSKESEKIDEEVIEPESFPAENHADSNDDDDHIYEDDEEDDLIVDNCCERQKKMIPIRLGETGVNTFINVGRCRRTCSRHLHRPGGKGSRAGITHMQPRNLACGSFATCESSRIREETHHTDDGIKTISVVTDCKCILKPQHCERQQSQRVYFPNSPYETEVDVGVCRGPCSSDLSCRPLRNKTVSIEGPNGQMCVEVIEECACASECYRMQRYETYFDHIWNSSANITDRTIKEIDVGLCVGECTGGTQHQCVLWDTQDSTRCLMSLTRPMANCSPTGFTSHRVSPTEGGHDITVLAINKCQCV